jgi:membrane protease YdiL (CAAX protease family)
MGWWRPAVGERSGPAPAPTWPVRLRRGAALIGFCLVALLATLLVQYVWTGLLSTNLEVSPAVPWSVLVMAILLWAGWRYAGGAWWPARTRSTRRRYRRANSMPAPVVWWAMGAGVTGLGGLMALWLVITQLIRIPGNQTASQILNYPLPTVVLGLVMASLVGAITEEVGLRGYMLTRLEASLRGWVAVVVVAVVISPGHAATQGLDWATLLWYFLADLMFGSLSLLTRSILPGIAVHALGLLIFFSVIWPTDRYRSPAPLGHQGLTFWIELVALVMLGAVSLLAFRRLASLPTLMPAGEAVSPT